MQVFLDNHLESKFEVLEHDGSYAEILDTEINETFAAHAYGNGDFYNHKIEFEEL
jgi:hypothetical protein